MSGPCPHVHFLAKVMLAEHIERLTVHKGFIVGNILVFTVCVGGWHNSRGFCWNKKKFFQQSHFLCLDYLILSLFIEINFAKKIELLKSNEPIYTVIMNNEAKTFHFFSNSKRLLV